MNFQINTTTDKLNNTAGIALAGKILSAIGLDLPDDKIISKQEKDVIKILTSLMLQGRSKFVETKLFRNNKLLKKALGINYMYSHETIRIYLDKLAKRTYSHALKVLHKVNMNLLKKVELTPTESFKRKYIPVDIDVTPMDNSRTNKEGVSRTYKGFDGYAPICTYIGKEGFMLDAELRPGKQHCQKDTPAYLKKNISDVNKLNLPHPALFRLDSGNDAFDTLKQLMKSEHFFIVKRNLRREPVEKWAELAESITNPENPRPGKYVYTGVLTGPHPKASKIDLLPDIDQVFRLTVRESDSSGNGYLIPKVDVEIYWTNMYEDPKTVIDYYHDHGTSEQFHSELKTDMDIERFPSGKFSVNNILLHIATIAFNTLRYIGQTALKYKDDLPYKHTGKRKRLRKVISDLIMISCKLVFHAGRWVIKFWKREPWLKVFCKLYHYF